MRRGVRPALLASLAMGIPRTRRPRRLAALSLSMALLGALCIAVRSAPAPAAALAHRPRAADAGSPTLRRPFWIYAHGRFRWAGDFSYSAHISYTDRSGHAPGGFSDIAVSLTGPWGAWQPYAQRFSFDSRPYRSLTFALKPTVAHQRWSCQFVKIGDVPVGISVNVARYGPAPVAGRWATYTIPLSALGVADTSIYKFAIQDQTGRSRNTWYVNRVGFLR